jgi:hypothetical protein
MAHSSSSHVYSYKDGPPEKYFGEEIQDHVGVVGIWSVGDGITKKCGGRATNKAAYGIYFGPNCPHNLSETIMLPEGESSMGVIFAELCAVTVTL